MLRELLIAFGLYEIARPRTVIDYCERIGLENPDRAELRPGAEHLARLEGAGVVWLLWRHGRGSRLAAVAFALAGLVAVVAPDPLIRLTQRVAYRNTDELRLKSWVRPAARALGVCYLLVTVLGWRQDGDGDSGGAYSSGEGAVSVDLDRTTTAGRSGS